jgi:hypothetical protein
LLHTRAVQEGTVREEELFGREFLIRRPLHVDRFLPGHRVVSLEQLGEAPAGIERGHAA